eukprot:514404-Prorocentrum_lima.AAC.1
MRATFGLAWLVALLSCHTGEKPAIARGLAKCPKAAIGCPFQAALRRGARMRGCVFSKAEDVQTVPREHLKKLREIL